MTQPPIILLHIQVGVEDRRPLEKVPKEDYVDATEWDLGFRLGDFQLRVETLHDFEIQHRHLIDDHIFGFVPGLHLVRF